MSRDHDRPISQNSSPHELPDLEERSLVGLGQTVLELAYEVELSLKLDKPKSVIFSGVVYIFLKGCRHEYAQKDPFNAACS